MKTFATTAPLLLALLALAACGKSDNAARDTDADGEVLEGSISDAMIPLAETTSQPPLAKGATDGASGTTETGSGEGAGEADAAPAAESTPEPAEPEAPVDALEAAE
ncbi:hypothetical protein VCJ71_11640 [Alteriqipengyuania sp. WL0013]|uniref:hypothetical protein n=1 Tax=Alteriqipengyuania sp. WL0013 TaxID=3110773 RepID=UPI002CD19252|nr:hypothetical protein [Alteriqipengyuania sp. WL0013]MEB3416721.1 hypothetical protein [Alteriqipengyuania sp. WL0013]